MNVQRVCQVRESHKHPQRLQTSARERERGRERECVGDTRRLGGGEVIMSACRFLQVLLQVQELKIVHHRHHGFLLLGAKKKSTLNVLFILAFYWEAGFKKNCDVVIQF